MEYFVYIIFSESLNRFYVDYISDLEKRLLEHNNGFSTFTSKAKDWVLKYHETFSSRAEARMREKEIKLKKSRKYIEWPIQSP